MRVNVRVEPAQAFPPVKGPHELAWSYLLDAVFADAYHAGVTEMDVVAPRDEVAAGCELRARLSRDRDGIGTPRRAIAALSGGDLAWTDHVRAYQLQVRDGKQQTSTARQTVNAGSDWRPEEGLEVFGVRARLWGVPIRLASLAGRPDLVDRAMAAMRHDFAGRRLLRPTYRLHVWAKA